MKGKKTLLENARSKGLVQILLNKINILNGRECFCCCYSSVKGCKIGLNKYDVQHLSFSLK